jgi:hypothetical protein
MVVINLMPGTQILISLKEELEGEIRPINRMLQTCRELIKALLADMLYLSDPELAQRLTDNLALASSLEESLDYYNGQLATVNEQLQEMPTDSIFSFVAA